MKKQIASQIQPLIRIPAMGRAGIVIVETGKIMKVFTIAIVLAVISGWVPAFGLNGVPGVDFVDNQTVISVRPWVDLSVFDNYGINTGTTGYASIDAIIANAGIVSIEPYYPAPIKSDIIREVVERMFIATVADPGRLESAITALDNDPNIEFAEPYYLHYLDYVPNDPLISGWYQLGRTEAYLAWDVIRGDSTGRTVVGIVDSGVYYDHPDLEPNMWINEPEDINGDGRFTNDDINGLDDDGNGRVDDVVGYDLAMNDPNPMEPTPTHGTHVAGCVSMATDNGYGGAATGWAARIMAVKVSRDSNPTSISHGYQGITYAADNGCDVINLSWGRSGSFSQAEQNVITAVYNQGVTVVAAAGNSNTSASHWPAAYSHVLAVAATNSEDIRASFSNYGSWVDISAPGVSVNSTWDHSSFMPLDGTSMASPVAAGAACLLKAANPLWSPDDIMDHLMDTADNIEDLNPSYRGLLGAGRVNSGAAVGRDLVPRIVLDSFDVTLTDDDGDGVLNPSESIELVTVLTNLWADAGGVEGVLRADENFIITDSTTSFGDISGQGGSGNNSSDPFDITVAGNALTGVHDFTLTIRSNSGYAVELILSIRVSLEQAGFPVDIPGNIESSPLIFDFDSNGERQIIISAADGKYYSIEPDGSNTAGWPQDVSGDAPGGAAIGDLDNDGDFEVVGVSKTGSIYVWDHLGNLQAGWPYNTSSVIHATPALADIDGNGDLEIIIGSFQSRKVYVLNHDGTDYPGWPFQGTSSFYGSAALADIDNDNLPEIIYAGFDMKVHAWNADQSYVSGFPVDLTAPVQASPAIADTDGDGNLNIIIAGYSGDLYIFDNDGTVMPGWPVSLGSIVRSSPAVSDIDSDGGLEIIVGSNAGDLHALNANGEYQTGFPLSLGSAITASPVIGDIDGNGRPDIIIGTGTGMIFAINAAGENLRNSPIETVTGASIASAAAISDLDGDGDAEIVVGVRASGSNLEVIDYKQELQNYYFPWPFYRRDAARDGNLARIITDVDQGEIELPAEFGLASNYPNPFNMNTIIRFSLPDAGSAEISIYDVLGREVKSFEFGYLNAGDHELTWNGLDSNINPVSSGVYFYNLKFGELKQTRRMVLIK